MQLGREVFHNNFGKGYRMGNLVLTRKPGESIDVYDPADACFGPIVITQGKVGSGKSSIAIAAPKHLMIKRSELVGKEPNIPSDNKYYSLGQDPIAAIAALGFTRSVGMFGVTAYVHESLPLDMRHHGSQEGWVCVLYGETVVLKPESFIELVSFVFQSMKMRGVK
jgi:sRNA-binding carbon storage regulator CsrA